MRNVVFVTKEELQSVVTRGERDFRLRLSGSEMQVVEVVRNWFAHRRHRRIDQEMVMTGIRAIGPGGGNAHISQSEMNRAFCGDCSSVLHVDEVDGGTRRRLGGPALIVLGQSGDERRCKDHPGKYTSSAERSADIHSGKTHRPTSRSRVHKRG